ncbi:MAG: hypothetical protein GY927_02550 [bacterium]|nr:hypothetical protein [bacterium]
MGRIFLRLVGLVILAGLLAGCSSHSLKLDSSTIGKIQNRKLALVVGPPPKLIINTPEKSLNNGLIATLLIHGMSDNLATDYGVTDPAKTVGQRLKSKLATKYRMSIVSSPASADILLRVSTVFWQVNHGALDFMSYTPRTSIVVELADRRSKKVLTKGTCLNSQGMTKKRGYDEILQNNGAVLKTDLDMIASKCASRMLAKL